MAAKKAKRSYGKGTQTEVKREMHRMKKGTAKSGKDGKGGKVKSKKQAVAIALSKARKKGQKVPKKSRKTTAKRKTAKSKTAKSSTASSAKRKTSKKAK